MKHNTPDKNDLASTQQLGLNKQYTYGSLNIGQLDFQSQNVDQIFQKEEKNTSQHPTFSQLSGMNESDTFGCIKVKYFQNNQKSKELNFNTYKNDKKPSSLNLFAQYHNKSPQVNTNSQNSLFANIKNDNSTDIFNKDQEKQQIQEPRPEEIEKKVEVHAEVEVPEKVIESLPKEEKAEVIHVKDV